MSLGMLARKYVVPFLLNRRRKRKEEEEDENEDKGYDTNRNNDSVDPEGVNRHVHEHVHTHKHKHENDFIMPPEDLPDPRTTHEIDELAKHSSGLNPGFIPYGLPVASQYHYPQPVAAHGLPPQFPNVPFSTRKQASAEQIMTIFGELMNEYQNDQTMTMNQVDILLRQRLKEKYNIE